MFREGDPEITLAQWAAIWEEAYRRLVQAIVETYRTFPGPEMFLTEPLFPRMIYRLKMGEATQEQVAFDFDKLFSKDVKP